MGLFDKTNDNGRTWDGGYDYERKRPIDRIRFDGYKEDLVWKFPYENIMIGAQIVINESQEAIFYNDLHSYPVTHLKPPVA